MSSAKRTRQPAPRLDPDAWTDAALKAVARAGLSAVSVERLAADLGATKGSFYWHFTNREALVRAVLERWESLATRGVIDMLETTPDPLERLHQLASITNRSTAEDRIEVALLFAADDPIVTPFVERVTRQRLEYVARVFGELGFDVEVAERRARILLFAYLGRLRLERALAGQVPAATTAYNRELVSLLTADRPER